MKTQRLAGAQVSIPAPRPAPNGLPTAERIAAALDGLTAWGERTPTTRQEPAHRDFSLTKKLGLPEELPPIRLLPQPRLAELARPSRLLARVMDLATWAAEHDKAELTPADAAEAIRDLGLRDDLELRRLWPAALDVRSKAASWPEADDQDVLFAWRMAMNALLDSAPFSAAAGGEISFAAVGGTVTILLFLARRDGVPCSQINELIRETTHATPAAWRAWTRRQGDPMRLLLDSLTELGALEAATESEDDFGTAITKFAPLGLPKAGLPISAQWTGEAVRLTPLGLWALWDQLTSGGLEIPVLPPIEDMTVPDLVDFSQVARPVELAAERNDWLAPRDPVEAARELLELAAGTGPIQRVHAIVIASGILKDRATPEASRAAWLEAYDRPETRPFAKVELTGLGSTDPEFQLTQEERSWMLVDLVMAHTNRLPESYIPVRLSGLLDGTTEQLVVLVESCHGQRHPAVKQALELLGRHFPDKQVAKAARRTIYKIESRNN